MMIRSHLRVVGALGLVLAVACSRHEPAPAPSPTPAPPVHPAVAPVASMDQLLDNLSMLATGTPLSATSRAATLDALRANAKSTDQYIDELVRDPKFAAVVIPRMLFGEINVGPMSYYAMRVLQAKEVDGQTVHFYRKQCAAADATRVAPWWDQAKPILICNADYKPEGFRAKSGYYCSGTMAHDEPECGCGPSLVNCVRDGKHYREVFESLYQESIRTIAYIVEHDQPFKDVFTTQNTFRDRNAEGIRIRETIYAGKRSEVPDLTSWPAEGQWAPREEMWPGSYAGILSTPHYLYMSDGPRDRMRLMQARTWCSTPASFGVTSAKFKQLVTGHASIRASADGWQALAAAPGCTDCHARMDYGMQFLTAYPANSVAVTPVLSSSRHTERGPLYLRDIEDPRGEAQLTAQALGQLIVQQPEFADCMVTRVKDHVLGPLATPEDRETLSKVFGETGQIRPLFVSALRLLVQRLAVPPPAPPARGGIAGKPATDEVVVSERLGAMLHEQCGDCHEDGEHGFFGALPTKHTLPRELLLTTANVVASDLMPKDGELRREDKSAMLEAIVEALALDDTWAGNARVYWLGGMTGSRTHNLSAVKARIANDTAYKLDDTDNLRTVEEMLEGDLLTVTPSYVTQIGQLAIKACRSLVKDPPRYRECLRKETSPESFLMR